MRRFASHVRPLHPADRSMAGVSKHRIGEFQLEIAERFSSGVRFKLRDDVIGRIDFVGIGGAKLRNDRLRPFSAFVGRMPGPEINATTPRAAAGLRERPAKFYQGASAMMTERDARCAMIPPQSSSGCPRPRANSDHPTAITIEGSLFLPLVPAKERARRNADVWRTDFLFGLIARSSGQIL